MVHEMITRVKQSNPPQSQWCVSGGDVNVCVDTGSLTTSVFLEHDDVVLEDACWLRTINDTQHINLAELDAVLNVINLALQTKVMHLKTDSMSVYHCLLDTLMRKAQIHTKATNKTLLWWKLKIMKQLEEEYRLSIEVTLVLSSQNLADPMSRVPQSLLEMMKNATKPAPFTCATVFDGMTSSQIF